VGCPGSKQISNGIVSNVKILKLVVSLKLQLLLFLGKESRIPFLQETERPPAPFWTLEKRVFCSNILKAYFCLS